MGVIFAILLSAASTCPHVRANGDPDVAFLIEEGSHVSATFRQLIAAVDRMDGPHRILRILRDLRHGLAELIGSLGHELQHALEVTAPVPGGAACRCCGRRIRLG